VSCEGGREELMVQRASKELMVQRGSKGKKKQKKKEN